MITDRTTLPYLMTYQKSSGKEDNKLQFILLLLLQRRLAE
jgi:hypothetical protein